MADAPHQSGATDSLGEPAPRRWFEHLIAGQFVVIGMMLVPFAVLLAVAATRRWYPTGDLAHTELMVRSIPRHPPLVGVAARVGTIQDPGSAPGPSMAYLLYPLYLILGRSSYALVVAYNALHAAALGGAIWWAWRRAGRTGGLAMALIAAVMVRAAMTQMFLQPWNVWIPVFAFLGYLLALWGVVERRPGCLAVAVALGAHCAQTHISYVPLVAATLAPAALWLAWRVGADGRRPWRSVAVAGVVGVAMMALPVIEQLRGGPGNLARLWRHFSSPPEAPLGLRAGVRGFFGEYNLFGPWIVGPGHVPTETPNIAGAAAMALLVGGGLLVAWRRRDRLVLGLYAVVAGATVVGLWATTRIFGTFYDYVIRWIWPLNAISVFVAALALGRALGAGSTRAGVDGVDRALTDDASPPVTDDASPPATDDAGRTVARSDRRVARVHVALAATTMAVLASATVTAARTEMPFPTDSRRVGGLARPLAPQLSRDARYLLRWHDPAALGGGAYGLVLEMERQGFHIGVDSWGRAAAQPFRVQSEETAATVLWFVTGDPAIHAFLGEPEAVLLARFDPRSPAEQARSTALREAINARLAELGRPELIRRLDEQYGTTQVMFFEALPADLHDQVVEYNDLRTPGAVFEVPIFWGLFDPNA